MWHSRLTLLFVLGLMVRSEVISVWFILFVRMEKKTKVNPITSVQKEILVEFISSKKEMYTGKLTPSYTREKMKQNWAELTNLLNGVPNGSCKDWKQWRKTWVDLKKNTKAKFSEQKRHSMGTGGGPPMPPPVDIEEKVLEIISPVAISGNEEIRESAVHFHFDFENHNTVADERETIRTYENTASELEIEPQYDIVMHDTQATHFHDYCMTRSDTPKMNKKDVRSFKPASPRRRRLTKSMRLQESLKTNERFLKITEKNVESEREYRQKKLDILQSISINKKKYYEQKIAMLERVASAATQIASTANDILANLQNKK